MYLPVEPSSVANLAAAERMAVAASGMLTMNPKLVERDPPVEAAVVVVVVVAAIGVLVDLPDGVVVEIGVIGLVEVVVVVIGVVEVVVVVVVLVVLVEVVVGASILGLTLRRSDSLSISLRKLNEIY